MASTFAAQLRTIAANSSNELDLRARRETHAESLIFDRSVAVKQDWDTIYQICVEGFQELCLLDARLREFEKNLYSPQAKDQDREQLNKGQNEALDTVIEQCLALLGGKVMLRPGVKAVEWLVRRFRVHAYNTGAFIAAFLPYHEMPIFINALSIIPGSRLINEWKFLGPYHKATSNVPRHAVVYSATHNDGFFSFLNNYVLNACQEDAAHPTLLRFWSGMVVEAVSGRLKQAKSGRKEVQRQRVEDVLLKILPLLSDGLMVRDNPEVTITCFTLSLVVASTADLEDKVLDSMMEAVATTLEYGEIDTKSALVCLTLLATRKTEQSVPRGVVNAFLKLDHPWSHLRNLTKDYPVHIFPAFLVRSILAGLKKSNYVARLTLLRDLLLAGPEITKPSTLGHCITIIFDKIERLSTSDPLDAAVHTRLVALLQEMNDSGDFSAAFSSGAAALGKDFSRLETILGSTIEPVEVELTDNPEIIEPHLPKAEKESTTISSTLEEIPLRSTTVLSFLASADSDFFHQIVRAFEVCCGQEENLHKFEALPLWNGPGGITSLYASFLVRIACGPFTTPHRLASLRLLLKSLERQHDLDTQALLPYISVLLADGAPPIRRSAAEVILAMERCAPSNVVEDDSSRQLGAKDLYESQDLVKVTWVPSTQLAKIIRQVYLPALEECILDASQVAKILSLSLSGNTGPVGTSQNSSKASSIDLKKSLRHSLFDLLTTHAVATPLINVKTGIIKLLDGVQKVGSQSKSKALAPILYSWASLSSAEAAALASREKLSLPDIDRAMTHLISARDKEAVGHILTQLEQGGLQPRPDLITAFFDHLLMLWDDLRHESQLSASIHLFDLAFSTNAVLARGACHVLQSATLSTEIIGSILEHTCAGLTQIQAEGPPKKRRRTSHSRQSVPQEGFLGLEVVLARLTFALELVDSSSPEIRPELLHGLFDILVTLRRLKDQRTSDSPYLLHLCLSSILAIVDKVRASGRPKVDLSSIRADLVIDCVRTSENPQVQTTALLLSASLTSIAPELMLHNVMPIFAFMGNSVFSKDDERSVYVSNQAIDQIIPPLVSTLKRQDEGSLIKSTSSLLSSFVAAFDHVPQHRRLAFYQRLLSRLGADDFAFAVIAMLKTRKREDDSIVSFSASLLSAFPAATQLLTYRKLVELTTEIFSENPRHIECLLDMDQTSPAVDMHDAALLMFQTGEQLLKNKTLKTQSKKLSEELREEFKICLHQILQAARDQKSNGPDLVDAARRCINALLELPSVIELFEIIPGMLQDLDTSGDQDLKPQALRVLTAQLYENPPKAPKTQRAALAFLANLEAIMLSQDTQAMKQAAIACMDRISELYGRKNVDRVVSSAIVIAGEPGLDSGDRRTQIMALLCLASMLEVLKEVAVPIVPVAMPRVFALLRKCLEEGHEDSELHNAAYSLLAAFISHVPFMVSEEYVQEILTLSAESCNTELEVSCTESRSECLLLLAHNIDLRTLTSCLSHTWDNSVENGLDAVLESVRVMADAVEHNPKSVVVRSADSISSFITLALDLRRVQLTHRDQDSYSDEEVSQIESEINNMSVKFIYKLNDTVFRPLFESWVDWAVKCADISTSHEKAKTLRQTSLFNLVCHFFDTLKSIVTSYASYIIDPANEIFRRMAEQATRPAKTFSHAEDEVALYNSLLLAMTATFSHDADGFFNAPSHCSPLAELLVSQLKLAAHKSMRSTVERGVIPAVVALATATLDTPAHHHVINHHLCQLRRSEFAAVRLASIRTELALTESEDVGEEWINNVVTTGTEGGGGSGETMVYVNELLEDDDEDVESEVRRWVRMVRERVGEDVFED